MFCCKSFLPVRGLAGIHVDSSVWNSACLCVAGYKEPAPIIILPAIFEDVPCLPKLAHQLVLPFTGCSSPNILHNYSARYSKSAPSLL